MIVGYCRIGAFEPSARLEVQRRHLAAVGAQKFFCEKSTIFGTKPELERAIEFAGKGDLIAITKPYRVARSPRKLLSLIARLVRNTAVLASPTPPVGPK